MTAATPNLIDAPGTPEAAWQGWPGLSRLPSADLSGLRSAVVFAAHPDDEVLGAGGTLSLLASAGVGLRLVSVTDGEASHPGSVDRNALAERRAAETAEALRELGAQSAQVIRLRFPDTGLHLMRDKLTAVVSNLARGFDACLAPWENDGHTDHEAVGRAAREAGTEPVFYPIWMWHWSFPADSRVPWHRACKVALPSIVAARKRAAIRCFASQLEPRAASLGPVLSPETTAHFNRRQETFVR